MTTLLKGSIRCLLCQGAISVRAGNLDKFRFHVENAHDIFYEHDILVAINFLEPNEKEMIIETVLPRIKQVLNDVHSADGNFFNSHKLGIEKRLLEFDDDTERGNASKKMNLNSDLNSSIELSDVNEDIDIEEDSHDEKIIENDYDDGGDESEFENDDVVTAAQNRAGENVELIEVDSDEENIATRRIVSRSRSKTPRRNKSLLSSTFPTFPTFLNFLLSNKRKLEEGIKNRAEKSSIDVFQFGDSTDSEGQSQPKFRVPSTPRGNNIFTNKNKSVNFTPDSNKSKMILTKPRSVSYTPPTLRTVARPDERPNPMKYSIKKATKGKKVREAPSINFDDVMVLSSDVDSS